MRSGKQSLAPRFLALGRLDLVASTFLVNRELQKEGVLSIAIYALQYLGARLPVFSPSYCGETTSPLLACQLQIPGGTSWNSDLTVKNFRDEGRLLLVIRR